MLRPNRGIVESSRNGVCEANLSMRILKDVRKSSLQHTRQAATKARGMLTQFVSAPASFNADQFHPLVLDEFMENPNSVRSAAHAGDDRRRQPAFGFQDLRAGLAPNHRMKISHHGGIRMSP